VRLIILYPVAQAIDPGVPHRIALDLEFIPGHRQKSPIPAPKVLLRRHCPLLDLHGEALDLSDPFPISFPLSLAMPTMTDLSPS
jgi:hypothetical protein